MALCPKTMAANAIETNANRFIVDAPYCNRDVLRSESIHDLTARNHPTARDYRRLPAKCNYRAKSLQVARLSFSMIGKTHPLLSCLPQQAQISCPKRASKTSWNATVRRFFQACTTHFPPGWQHEPASRWLLFPAI